MNLSDFLSSGIFTYFLKVTIFSEGGHSKVLLPYFVLSPSFSSIVLPDLNLNFNLKFLEHCLCITLNFNCRFLKTILDSILSHCNSCNIYHQYSTKQF